MRLLASFVPSASPSADEIRRRALCTAVLLRNCSFRAPFHSEERRMCRALMRGQAHQWRRPDWAQGTF
jgi:hypothetical protein